MLHRRRHDWLPRREISILRQLRHPCIVDLREVLPPPDDPAKFRDLYLVFEYHPLPHLHRDWARLSHICTGTGLTPPTSAPGLGSPLPHLHRDRAHPSHICTGTGLASPTSAPGPGSPLPHLHRDRARLSHICIGTGLTPPTSAPGPGSPLPHLHRDRAHRCHICSRACRRPGPPLAVVGGE